MKEKIKSFDKLPQIVKKRAPVDPLKKVVKKHRNDDEYHYYPPLNMRYPGVGQRDREVNKRPQNEDEWGMAHLKDKSFSCRCKDCRKTSGWTGSYPTHTTTIAHFHHFLREKKRVLSTVNKGKGRTTYARISEAIVAALRAYHDEPNDENFEKLRERIRGSVNYWMKKLHHPRGAADDHLEAVFEKRVKVYWRDQGACWQETINTVEEAVFDWLQGKLRYYPSIDDDVKEKLDPFLLCDNPYTTYVELIKACINKIKFEYYQQESMRWIDESHRTIEEDSFMERASWLLTGGGKDFRSERTFKGFGEIDSEMLNFKPDLYLDITKKRVSEVREPEDDLIRRECREMIMLDEWSVSDIEFKAAKEAHQILKYKKALLKRRHPEILAYMKTLDIDHPLWLLFCYTDEVSFYMLVEELKDTHFFPKTHSLRIYKILDMFWRFRQLFKDPFLKHVQEDEFMKRHRSQKAWLKKKNQIDKFIETALPRETYNKYLHKDETEHPSWYEGTRWVSWLTDLVEKGGISYSELARLLPGISEREHMKKDAAQRHYEEFEKAMDKYYDELSTRDFKLFLIILKRVLYKKLIQVRAELAWLLKDEPHRYGKFEDLDEEEEVKREEKIREILNYFQKLPKN